MELIIAALLIGSLLLLGLSVYDGFQQRRDRWLKSKVIAATSCSVVITDAAVPRHPVIYANPAFRLLTGYADDDVLGQSLSILHGPQTDRGVIEKLALAMQDGRPCRVTVRHYRKTGAPFWNEVTLSPVKNRAGAVTEFIWVMSDVTSRQQAEALIKDAQERDLRFELAAGDMSDRRQAEEALRESLARFELAVQVGHVGIFEHDHRTDRLDWSPVLRDLYGVGTEEPVTLQRYLELVPAEERTAVLSAIQAAHDPAGDGALVVEHHVQKAGGEIRRVAVRARTFFEGAGAARRPVRTLGIVVEITERRQAEASRRDSSKMDAIGALAGGIAHEFNNSLTAVLGFSELALPLIPADSKAHRHIQQVVAAGRKSRELVHQLLTFSQRSEQVQRPLSLHALLKEALKLLRPTIPSWVEMREHIAVSTRPISADTTRIHQLILNLVENALHAMRQSGGLLDIRLEDRTYETDQVSPSGRLAAGCYVCLTVRDTGEGMDPEVANRIFDPFFTTAPPGQGRGMGLSVVHDIAAAHGGTVWVESQVDAGTTVSVYLPALPPRAAAPAPSDLPLPRGHECILFVDDEESLARLGGEMLESLGYYPVVRMNAAEAWHAFSIAPQQFDLLITDQCMPGLNGDMLARDCQRLRPDLPVILCTGSDQTLTAAEARAQGVTEYLLKPLALHDLAHTIRRLLDAREAGGPPRDAQTDVTLFLEEEPDAVSTRR